ncbi:hypothetical protein D3C81_859420 [compost metagenome]
MGATVVSIVGRQTLSGALSAVLAPATMQASGMVVGEDSGPADPAVVVVPAERRVAKVPAESRLYVVPAESRAAAVAAEPRAARVEHETRGLEIPG